MTRYQALLDQQAVKASDYIRGAVGAYMGNHPGASVAETRSFVVDLMQAALPNFTDLAETLSCEFMQELCDSYGWDDVRPTIHDTTDYRKVEERIRYLARELANGDDQKFKDDVADVTGYFVRRSAQDNMIENCKDAKVRFARVPSGLETCPFCFMLASRGFVYWSEESAGGQHSFHPHCTCTVVPGAKGRTKIDGYDPQAMHENWEICRDALGGSEQLSEDWDALPAEEKARWMARYSSEWGGDAKAKNAYIERRIMDEVETRDWHWLYTGEPPVQDYSRMSRDSYGRFINEPDRTKRPNPDDYLPGNIDFTRTNRDGEWRDLYAHDVLRWNGYHFETRPKNFPGPDGKNQQRATSPDLSFARDVWGRGYLWEVKSPRFGEIPPKPGNELSFISNVFEDARERNFRNPYDPVTNAPVADWDGRRRVVLNLLYRQPEEPEEEVIEKVRKEMAFYEISEVIVINGDGSILHLKD